MGMLLMTQDGAPLIREHMSLSVTKPTHTGSNIGGGIVNDVDNNDSNETMSNNELTRFPVLEIINVDADNEKPIPRMSPPPKKKWMRHYLLMEEEPLESNRANGNHSIGLRGSPVIANARGTLTNPNSTASAHVTSQHHHIHHYHPQSVHQHHNNHNSSTHNHYVENYNSNHTPTGSSGGGPLVVDVETTHDNKKHRNGPCVIRSGTREVHNKLEKNRRAHLKECFELLKKQLPAQDEKKSSNLSILHAAIRHIQALRRKERDYEHEMEKLAREKIASQQRVAVLKRELSATWDHIDFSTLLQEQTPPDPLAIKNVSESMDVDLTGLARSGPRYSSTSSLSSAATANSPQNFQSTNTTSSIQSQVATAAVVCQTQGLNLAQSSRESPPASSSPGASTPSIPTPAQEKVTTSPAVVQQSHQLHLPISAQMLNTSQGLATIVPTLQHLGTGLRVIPGDTRQLLVTHTTGNTESRPLTLAVQNSNDQSRPLIAVQSSTGSEPRPVALVVHSSAANDNRVTFVHSSNLSNQERPLALAVQSSSNDRPITFVHSGNEGRPLVLATHPPPLNVTTAQTRIRSGDSQTTHKMVGGVALVSGNGSELTRLPGGAELNILPANGVFRSVKAQPIAVQGGLTLSHAGVSLQTSTGKTNSTVMQNTPSTESITHIVSQHTPLSGLTPIVTPMTVVSQGNQVTAHILAPSNLAGKMITTPILKPVGQVPLVNAQYLNTTTLVKPVVVVSSPSNTTTASTVTSSSQPSVTSNSSV